MRGKLKEKVWRRNREGAGGIERERGKGERKVKNGWKDAVYTCTSDLWCTAYSSTCTV